jgi:phage gpG-like protein
MSIQINITQNIDKKLAAITLAGLNLDEAAEEIGQDFVSLVQLGFRLSEDPYGKGWKKLEMRKGKPLEDTGHLRQSFTAETTSESIVVGTNTPYAATHHFGAVIVPVKAKTLAWKVKDIWYYAKKVNIPARPMIPNESDGLPEEWQDVAIETLTDYIEEAVNNA